MWMQGLSTYFLEEFCRSLEKVSKSDFDRTKLWLLKELKAYCEDNKCMSDEADTADNNWGQICSGDFQFDLIAREVECIDSIALEDIKSWLKSHIDMSGGLNFKKLSVQIEGVKQSELKKDDPLNGNKIILPIKVYISTYLLQMNIYVETDYYIIYSDQKNCDPAKSFNPIGSTETLNKHNSSGSEESLTGKILLFITL